ncbi:MAG: metallophosphoesterase [Clostridia bacterium]|nr:metallophosphoesterase [Clostridia bacterium]
MSRIKPLYDGIKLNAAITSDNHIDINAKDNKRRIKTIQKTLKDVQNSEYPVDAYITVGDTTSRGITENWEIVKECFKGFKPAKKIIFTIGNHDSWDKGGYKGYSNSIGNFYKYSKEICSNEIDKPYFSREINGYHFIFLGSTEVPFDEDCAALGDEQIGWLKTKLDEAQKSKKPIFVFCHQSINNNHGLPRTWDDHEQDWAPEIGGIGGESDKVKEIIVNYQNVYYFSGHSHMGLNGEKSLKANGYASFEEHDGVNYINLPCLTRFNHHGENEKIGWGIILEVYDNKVVIRPRNFAKKKMNRKIIIKDGKPYLENTI